MSEETDRYAWFEETHLFEWGCCLTFVKGSDPRQVAWAFGGDLDGAAPMDLKREQFRAAVRQIDEWTLVVEDGYQGSRPEVLRRLRGETVSVYRNVEAVTRFSVAAHGSIRTEFDAFMPDDRDGEDPDAIAAQLAGLPWNEAEPMRLMLALAERVSGFALRPEQLEGQFAVVTLLPWPADIPTSISPPAAEYIDKSLWEAIERAPADARHRAAWVAVKLAARSADVLDDPVLAPVLAGESATREQTAKLDAYARQLEPQNRWPLFRTVEAARAALSPHSEVAVWEAVTSAQYAMGSVNQPTASMRTAVLAVLSGELSSGLP
jgi:Family of unknown function (DUF6461)